MIKNFGLNHYAYDGEEKFFLEWFLTGNSKAIPTFVFRTFCPYLAKNNLTPYILSASFTYNLHVSKSNSVSCKPLFILHNENDIPALVWSDGSKQWFKDGALHRDNGPAWISPFDEKWYKNGVAHRLDGPALKDEFRSIWVKNGMPYVRPDGGPYYESKTEKIWCDYKGNDIQIEKIKKKHDLDEDWTKWTEAEKMIVKFEQSHV